VYTRILVGSVPDPEGRFLQGPSAYDASLPEDPPMPEPTTTAQR
jgi:hypothetical protein